MKKMKSLGNPSEMNTMELEQSVPQTNLVKSKVIGNPDFGTVIPTHDIDPGFSKIIEPDGITLPDGTFIPHDMDPDFSKTVEPDGITLPDGTFIPHDVDPGLTPSDEPPKYVLLPDGSILPYDSIEIIIPEKNITLQPGEISPDDGFETPTPLYEVITPTESSTVPYEPRFVEPTSDDIIHPTPVYIRAEPTQDGDTVHPTPAYIYGEPTSDTKNPDSPDYPIPDSETKLPDDAFIRLPDGTIIPASGIEVITPTVSPTVPYEPDPDNVRPVMMPSGRPDPDNVRPVMMPSGGPDPDRIFPIPIDPGLTPGAKPNISLPHDVEPILNEPSVPDDVWANPEIIPDIPGNEPISQTVLLDNETPVINSPHDLKIWQEKQKNQEVETSASEKSIASDLLSGLDVVSNDGPEDDSMDF